MKNKFALIVPAAGRGSRFAKFGENKPKPLIDLYGRPFFWWSVESMRQIAPLRQIIFVVLEEHISEYSIDTIIKSYYPGATIVAIPEVTSGAAETATIGIAHLYEPGPVAINDCDHAFICTSFEPVLRSFESVDDGLLMGFKSANPAYSYVKFNSSNQVTGTVEKKVASSFAIAGCYLFADSIRFIALYERYKRECPYPELFVSGMFNLLIDMHLKVHMLELDKHCSFGTPEEKALITDEIFSPFLSWIVSDKC